MRASGYNRVASDWYVEPPSCVDALLDVEPLRGLSWDPSCGSGNIPRRMIARGLECVGSDIEDRGYGEPNVDFFEADRHVANIISNPPYGLIEPYIRHALGLAERKVCILARLALLEGQRRRGLFQTTPLARVWVSAKRISMPPGGSGIRPEGGSIAYAWFVWDHDHTGPATVGWI